MSTVNKDIAIDEKKLEVIRPKIASLETDKTKMDTKIATISTTKPTQDAKWKQIEESAEKIATERNPAAKELLVKDAKTSLGITPELDDITTQAIKRRSKGHAVLGIIKGVLGVAGGIAAVVGAVAGTALLAATPVGWAIGATAAAIGIGLVAYKIIKTVQRNNKEGKLKEQASELNTMKQDFTAQKSALPVGDPKIALIDSKIQKVEELEKKVKFQLLKNSPEKAKATIIETLTSTSTDPVKLKEKEATKIFLRQIYKIDADVLVSTDPLQTKAKKATNRLLDKKIVMFA